MASIEETFRNAGFHREAGAASGNGSRFQLTTTTGKRTRLGTYGDTSVALIYGVAEARDGKVFVLGNSKSKADAESLLENLRSGGTYTPPAAKCWKCKGTGQFRSYGKCFACNGKG